MLKTRGVYVVIKQGVYVQGVYGPYGTKRSALIAAQRLAAADRDDYHEYEACPLTRDGLGDPFCEFRQLGKMPFSYDHDAAYAEDRKRNPRKRGGSEYIVAVTPGGDVHPAEGA